MDSATPAIQKNWLQFSRVAIPLLADIMNNHREEFQERLRKEKEFGDKQIAHSYPTASMQYPRWPLPALLLSPLVAWGLDYAFNSLWFWLIPVCVLVYLICQQQFFICCPRCSRRLSVRWAGVQLEVDVKEHRLFYDCPDCRVTWDPNTTAPGAKY